MFITPYRYEKTGLNRHLVAKGEKVVVRSGIKGIRCVGPGYTHCYTNIEDAKLIMRYFLHNFASFKSVIVKCIIESGTRYYKSWDGKEIAADSVFIREIIET